MDAYEIFGEVFELEPEARASFLDEACGADAALRKEVESLLSFSNPAGGFLGVEETRGIEEREPDAAAQPPDPVPESIGRYRIVRKLGEGGMGVVFEAVQEHPERTVALKVTRPGLFAPALQQRFEYEAEILGRLKHPGIAHIYEAGTCDLGHGPQAYFAMELVEGSPLTTHADERELTLPQRLELMALVCDAAHHAHQRRVVHRDLKPDNILVDPDGQPKILDFGIARVTDDERSMMTLQTSVGQIVGTLAYMSPEQVSGSTEDVGVPADVYALGVVCYELFCGRLPQELSGVSITEAAQIISGRDIPLLGGINRACRGDVETIVAKALAKESGQRYHSAGELAADIRRFLADEPIVARPPTAIYQLHKFARRHKAFVGGVVATVLALIGGVIVSTLYAIEAAAQRGVADYNAYRIAVRAANDQLHTGKHAIASGFLEGTREDLRGWEWDFVSSGLRQWARELPVSPGLKGGICYTPDATAVIGALVDGTVGVLDLATGELRRPFVWPAKIVAITDNLASSPPRLAAGTEDGRVLVWELAGAKAPTVLEGHEGAVVALTWSPQGELFTAGRHRLLRWRRGSDPTPLVIAKLPTGEAVGELAVAHDLSAVFARTQRGVYFQIRRWDLGRDVESEGGHSMYYHRKTVECMACSPDGKRVVAGTRFQNLHVLHASNLQPIEQDGGHDRSTSKLLFSPDGSLLASTSPDGVITLRDGNKNSVLRLLARGKSVTALAFRQDGRQLAVGDSDGRAVTLWNLPSESSLMLGGPAGSHVTTADAVCWSPDGSLLASGTKTSCHLWDAWTGERIHLFEGRPPIAFSADSERLLTSSAVIDLATGVAQEGGSADLAAFLQESGSMQGNGRWISPVSPDRKIMVTKGNSLAVVTFPDRVESGRLIGHRGYVYGAGFSSDGRWIVSGGADRSVRIWDARSCEQVGALAAGVHPDTVMCVAFSPDGTRIATGCRDNLVRIFDVETKELLLELAAHRSHIAAIQWSPDGTRIATASGDATARIWDAVPRQERFAQARAAATLRAELFPRVERLLHELGDPAAVATRLRGDSTLVGVRRQAALRVLLRLALQR